MIPENLQYFKELIDKYSKVNILFTMDKQGKLDKINIINKLINIILK